MPEPGSARGQLLRRIALAATATALALITAEIALKALDYQHDPLALFEPRSGDGYRLKSDLDLTLEVRDRAVQITTNFRGLPWREVEESDGRPRIAVLGDSFAFGLWASDWSAAFPAVFERGIDPGRYEVINFGVPGYGYADMTIQLTEDVLPLEPTWVVLVSYNGNDYLDTWFGPNRYRVTANGALEQDRDAIAALLPSETQQIPVPGGRLVDRSPLLRMTRAVAHRVLPRREPDADPGTGWTSNLVWSAKRYPDYAAQARDVGVTELTRIDDLVRGAGARLVLVALPYAEQVEQPELFGDEHDIDLPQRDLAALAEVRDLPFLDLRPGMAASDRQLFIQSEGHLADAGHELVGQLLADFFRSEVAPSE